MLYFLFFLLGVALTIAGIIWFGVWFARGEDKPHVPKYRILENETGVSTDK